MLPNHPKFFATLFVSRFGSIQWLILAMLAAFTGVSMATQVSVTLSNLTQTYNGSPIVVGVSPAELTYTVTYAGSTTPPVNAGSYPVVATVTDPGQTGTATGTLVINKASQTITFATPSGKTYGDAPFALAGTSSSGLPISYTSSPAGVVTISGSTVTITGAGSTFITANQPGDINYFAAPFVRLTLTVNKKSLSFSLVVPAGKTYGDAPFAVSATVTNGLSIAKWESADPSVATVSPTGEVTIVGAGQTSIIVSIPSSDSLNYAPAWIAKPLNVARSAAPLPSGTQSVTYNGSPQGVAAATLPSGLATEITYSDSNVAAASTTPEVVFQNGPDTLALSYPSTGMQATGLWSQAKYAELGGTARKLHSCDVTLVTWAGYYGGKDNNATYRYKEWADLQPQGLVVHPTPDLSNPGQLISVPGNSGGYYHPVTLAFYEYDIVGETESYRLLTSKTVQAFIPWRPEKLADGVTAYTEFFGYAFRVPFDFPEGVILPDQVWVAVSFNTQSFGVAPIGASGPYDALNIPSPEAQQAGTSLLGTQHFFFKDWRWQQATQTRGPMLRLRAVPTSTTSAAPVNAGTYQVKTQATAFGAAGSSSSTLVIDKAPLEISLTNLTQVRDGSPKAVIVSTTPGGIASTVTYAGSAVIPSALGTYPVTASSANPNYEGQANATLQIGDSFAAWQTATFAGSGLPQEQITDAADPDRDGLSNFLEYASNLNPLAGNHPAPVRFEPSGGNFAFTYRRNLHALDLEYAIQGAASLNDVLSWNLVTPLGETIVSDDGSTRVIRATVAKPVGRPSYFMRLRTRR
jgi:MBG domain